MLYLHIYADRAKRWRWSLRARNGRKVAQSSEGDGYPSEGHAARAFKTVRMALFQENGVKRIWPR